MPLRQINETLTLPVPVPLSTRYPGVLISGVTLTHCYPSASNFLDDVMNKLLITEEMLADLKSKCELLEEEKEHLESECNRLSKLKTARPERVGGTLTD